MLLAYKPFIYRGEEDSLHPAEVPGWRWPILRTVTSPCPKHSGPEENCTCGVLSSLDAQAARQYTETIWKAGDPEIPLLGVVQVLGKTLVDGLFLRSYGAFIYGLVFVVDGPQWTSIQERNYKWLMARTNLRRLNPVWYWEFEDSLKDVRKSVRKYDIHI
jgi:hypothetical protein